MARFEIKGTQKVKEAVNRLTLDMNVAFKDGANNTLRKAQRVAQGLYDNAEYDGVNDAQVKDPQWINDNTALLTATGKSLLFIEFGAGIRYYYPVNPYANKFNYNRADYGHGRANKRGGLWIYNTQPNNQLKGPDGSYVLTRHKVGQRGERREGVAWSGGNPATCGMYEALKVIQQNLISDILVAFK